MGVYGGKDQLRQETCFGAASLKSNGALVMTNYWSGSRLRRRLEALDDDGIEPARGKAQFFQFTVFRGFVPFAGLFEAREFDHNRKCQVRDSFNGGRPAPKGDVVASILLHDQPGVRFVALEFSGM